MQITHTYVIFYIHYRKLYICHSAGLNFKIVNKFGINTPGNQTAVETPKQMCSLPSMGALAQECVFSRNRANSDAQFCQCIIACRGSLGAQATIKIETLQAQVLSVIRKRRVGFIANHSLPFSSVNQNAELINSNNTILKLVYEYIALYRQCLPRVQRMFE